MYDSPKDSGKTTIAPEVLIDITRLAALSVEHVARLAPVPGGVNRLFRRGSSEGVQILVEGNRVDADIYLILYPNVSIREICKEVQSRIAREIEEMVGMEIGSLNIHVEDIAINLQPSA